MHHMLHGIHAHAVSPAAVLQFDHSITSHLGLLFTYSFFQQKYNAAFMYDIADTRAYTHIQRVQSCLFVSLLLMNRHQVLVCCVYSAVANNLFSHAR